MANEAKQVAPIIDFAKEREKRARPHYGDDILEQVMLMNDSLEEDLKNNEGRVNFGSTSRHIGDHMIISIRDDYKSKFNALVRKLREQGCTQSEIEQFEEKYLKS